MKIPTLLLLANLLMAGCALHSASQLPHARLDLITQTKRSLVQLRIGAKGVCSAFVIDASKGRALTAAHCLPVNGEDFLVDGVPSQLIATTESIALISIPPMSKPPLEIRPDAPPVGEEVLSLGFAHGIFTVVRRMIASYLDQDLILDGELYRGMSGGPVVDEAGRVVGINQMSNPAEGMSLVCGNGEIQSFLKANR